MDTNGSDDYWTQHTGASPRRQGAAVEMQTISDIVPLGDQFDADRPKPVPDELLAPLFGPIETSDGLQDDPPANTYALLDAAKIEGLPEILDASGLDHRCLFTGDAFEELKDVAPWLVRLEESNSFTRNLFTRSDAPWHIWDSATGLYLRSCGNLELVWRHLRKFTRVRDEQGKWFYFRFWEANCLTDYLRFAQTHGQTDLRPVFGFDRERPSLPLIRRFVSVGHGEAKICAMDRISGHNSDTVTELDISVLRFLALRQHAHRFAESYFEPTGAAVGPARMRQAQEVAIHIAQKYHRLGFKSRYHLGSFTYWALALNADFESRTQVIEEQVRRTGEDPNDRFVLIAREMKALFGSKIRTYHGHGS